MELSEKRCDKKNFIETSTGNRGMEFSEFQKFYIYRSLKVCPVSYIRVHNLENIIETEEKRKTIKVSRKAGLYGSQNIVLSGKVFVEPDCIIRGDLAHVRVGRFSIVKEPFAAVHDRVRHLISVVRDQILR